MSAKNTDMKGRWRNVTIAFRVTPEEAAKIDMLAKTSGLLKPVRLSEKCLLCFMFPSTKMNGKTIESIWKKDFKTAMSKTWLRIGVANLDTYNSNVASAA